MTSPKGYYKRHGILGHMLMVLKPHYLILQIDDENVQVVAERFLWCIYYIVHDGGLRLYLSCYLTIVVFGLGYTCHIFHLT